MISKILSYMTNSMISHIPFFAVRTWWYRTIVGIRIGKNSSVLMGCFWCFYRPFGRNPGVMIIGDNTIINRRCSIDGRGGFTIGHNVSLSPEVMLITASHLKDDPKFVVDYKSITIEDYAWVGSRATIMPGVTIGKGAVVAVGAVVTKDVPPFTVVAGIPAKQIASREQDLSYELVFSPWFE